MPGERFPVSALIPRPRLPRPVGDGLRDGRSRLCGTDVSVAHRPHRRRGRAADGRGPRRARPASSPHSRRSPPTSSSSSRCKSLQGYSIEDYGYQLGRAWGIGQKGKDNGVLLIVAPNDRKVRIEVGRGLEPMLTDALSSIIIEHAIVPEFRAGDFAAGIKAGVRDIKDVLLGDAEAVKERAQGARRDNSPDTMQVILLIFWICVVFYIL